MEKLIEHQKKYSGKIIEVFADVVAIDQEYFERDLITHPGGVGIIAMNNNTILLVKQYRHAIKAVTYEIPAGKIEPNECLNDCASRELEEECGVRALNLEHRLKMHPSPGICDECLHLFSATEFVKVDNPKPMDPDEKITAFFMPIEEALQAVINNQITDAKTMFAIYYAHANLTNF